MYCVKITNKWTNSVILYPRIFDSETEAINTVKRYYSEVNNTFKVNELSKIGWAISND